MRYPAPLETPNDFEPKIAVLEKSDELKKASEARKQVASIPIQGSALSGATRLAPPKPMVDRPAGISRLVLFSGAKASASFNNGDSTEPLKRQEAERQLKEEPFSFAPGEDRLQLGWKVTSPDSIASVKLELFCKTQKKSIGTAEWKGVVGPKLTMGPNEQHRLTGSCNFSEALFAALPEKLFPDGVLTVEHSPYQLRMTVVPKEGAKAAYPQTAWTHFHVLVHSVEIGWGEEAWLDDVRPDVGDERRPKLLADEKKVFAALKRLTPQDALLPVPLPGNVLTGQGAMSMFGSDWKKHWGDGARIPLKATVRLRKADGSPSAEAAKKALGKATLLWDWEDPQPGKLAEWLKLDPKPSLLSQRRLLAIAAKEGGTSGQDFPEGSTNAPVAFGGKRGPSAAPVFLPKDGTGAFPFEVTAADGASKRPWAAHSKCGTGAHAGASGVLFQPSRTLGDTFRVNVYVVAGGEDLTQAAEKKDEPLRAQLEKVGAAAPPFASTGCFEVRREIDLHLYAYPTHDGALYSKAAEYYRKVAATEFALDLKTTLPPLFLDAVKVQEVHDDALGRNPQGFLRDHILVQPAGQPDAHNAVLMRSHAAYRAHVEEKLRTGLVQALVLDKDLTVNAKGKRVYPRVKNARGTAGWLLGRSLEVADCYYVLLADKTRPFAENDTLKPDDKGEAKVTRVASKASAWGADVKARLDTTRTGNEAKVDVALGGKHLPLAYEKKGVRRLVSRSLSDGDLTKLRQALVDAALASDGKQPLSAVITGVHKDDRSYQRLQNVVAALRQAVKDELVVDTRHVWDQLLMEPESALKSEADYPLAAKPFVIGDDLAKKSFVTELVGDGIHYFAFDPYSQASFIPAGAVFSSDPSLPHKNIAYHVAPLPSPSIKQGVLPTLTLFVHELAHALHLTGHANAQLFDSIDQGVGNTSHVTFDTCVMNYDTDPTSLAFCGMCQLRLRGWEVPSAEREVPEADALQCLEDEANLGGPNAEWRWMRLAYQRSKSQAVVDAQKKLDKAITKARNDAQDAFRKSPKGTELKEKIDALDGKKKRSASEEQRLQALREQKSALETAQMANAEQTKLDPALREDVKRSFLPAVEAARKAWEVFQQNGGTDTSPLGVTMLRNLVTVEARYGEARRAIELWTRLKEITQSPFDLDTSGPKQYVEALLGGEARDEYRFTLELGDLSDLFPSAATSAEGKMERLQAMGLFPVPVNHPRASEALAVAWAHATRLIPDLGSNPGALDREVRAYLLSTVDGKLPAEGSFAKLRLAAHTPVLYSQHLLQYMFPERDFPKDQGYQEGFSREEAPHAGFMIGAQERDPDTNEVGERTRFRIEDDYLEANAALGKIPLQIKVERRPVGSTKDSDWQPSQSPLVHVALAHPDDLPAYDAAKNKGRNEVGKVGVSFHQGVTPPALGKSVDDFLKGKLDAYMQPDEDDPQAHNAHANLGGKRGLDGEGRLHVQARNPRGATSPNVFCDVAGRAFADLTPTAQTPFPEHGVCVRADSHGVARLVFAPSKVGGDRYKLRVALAPVAGEAQTSEHTTGTLVRWRTVRISRFVRMDPHTGDGDLTPSLLAQKASAAGKDLQTAPKLEALDLTGYAAGELAKAYTEVIFDPQALTPVSASQFKDSFLREAKALVAAHPTANRPEACRRGKERAISIFRLPLPAEGESKTKFAATLPCKIDKGTLSIRPKGGGADKAVCDDSALFTARDRPSRYDFAAKNGHPLTRGHVDYDARRIEIEFSLDQSGGFEACFFPDDFVDVEKILEFPAKSPYLFNLKSPEAYNRAIAGTPYLPFEADPNGTEWAKKPVFAGSFIDDRSNGLVKGLFLQAFARAIDDNGGLSPGLNVIHSAVIDNWAPFLASGTQEGKGVGQAIYLFGGSERVALHEIAHGIYLQHAPDASGAKAHQHAPDAKCVMNYTAGDKEFCGLCVASLRGMRIDDEPFHS